MGYRQKIEIMNSSNTHFPYRTFEELQKLFPQSWILLLDPETQNDNPFKKNGLLVEQNRDKTKLIAVAQKLPKGSRFAFVFTGEVDIAKT